MTRCHAGTCNPNAKLDEQTARDVFIANGTLIEIGKRFGVKPRTARAIRNGDIWRETTKGLHPGVTHHWRRNLVEITRDRQADERQVVSDNELRRRMEIASRLKRELAGAQIFDHPKIDELLPV